jgi:hypothetical protein
MDFCVVAVAAAVAIGCCHCCSIFVVIPVIPVSLLLLSALSLLLIPYSLSLFPFYCHHGFLGRCCRCRFSFVVVTVAHPCHPCFFIFFVSPVTLAPSLFIAFPFVVVTVALFLLSSLTSLFLYFLCQPCHSFSFLIHCLSFREDSCNKTVATIDRSIVAVLQWRQLQRSIDQSCRVPWVLNGEALTMAQRTVAMETVATTIDRALCRDDCAKPMRF